MIIRHDATTWHVILRSKMRVRDSAGGSAWTRSRERGATPVGNMISVSTSGGKRGNPVKHAA